MLEAKLPDLVAVYLYGSSVQEQTHPESDLDLAVLTTDPLDPVQRWTLQEDLAVQLHRAVDLLDLRAVSTVMQVQVVAHGEVVLDADPVARQRFEMQALAAYALLNEERRAILVDVYERGRVYGR